MPRKPKEDSKNPRGVYEKVKGSNEWWVLYYDKNGTRHRKKIGPKSLAIDVYRKMKNQIREDAYFPEKKRKRSTVGEAIDRFLEVAADNRSHETDLMHSRLLKDAFKNKVLRDLEPHEIREVDDQTSGRHIAFNRKPIAGISQTGMQEGGS